MELILHDQHPGERSVPGCLVLLFAVVASEKGVVVGRLTFREDGDLIDCQRMGVGGKAIPPNVDKVNTSLSSFAPIKRLVVTSCKHPTACLLVAAVSKRLLHVRH